MINRKVNPLKTRHVNIEQFKSSIKKIQPHPEDRLDSEGLFMKSKYEEALKKKESLLIANKELNEKIKNLNVQNEVGYIESKQLKENQEVKSNSIKKESKENAKAKDAAMTGNQASEQFQEKEEKQETELNQEDLKDVVFNEEQFKEYTYILVKNFEVQKLDMSKLQQIFDEIDKEGDEIVLNDLALKIAKEIKISSLHDQSKILIYIHSLLVFCENGKG